MSASIEVLHACNHVLCVAKPARVPTVPDDSGDPSMLDLAKAWIKADRAKPGEAYVGVVHRLDRPVSGVLCLARTSKAAARLTAAFHDRLAEKRYVAVVEGTLRGEGEVDHWLLKKGSKNVVRVVREGTERARRAQTRYRATAHARGRTLVELEPRTGRPHQLRVAMASLGHPIVGDLKYGAAAPLPDRSVALHARRLVVPHPTRDAPIDVTARPPETAVWELTRLA
ncbi:MAG: RNA pseudouridine synthase [Planctomycetota bacterium]